METELKSLKIDRGARRDAEPSRWATRWILGGITLLVLAGAARFTYQRLNSAKPVDTVIVRMASGGEAEAAGTVLNATGYIVAHHKIEVAAKVIGKVLWIGVEKGDRVREGQVVARLEDQEYRAQLQQAQGNLASLQAKLAESQHGSRPEEVAVASANVEQAKADVQNAAVTLERTKKLTDEGVLSKQNFDDAKARFDGQVARVNSLEKTYALSKLGPRAEQIDALRGQVDQARGQVAFAKTQLDDTVIRAPVTGTILERAVEKGEFITTSFVGDRGAKGFVVSMADLHDLQVELDIAQNDFAKLHPRQRGIVTTDAFPDRHYNGSIFEMSPEANRQKATVQVKVKIENPDNYLRPEMNASVAFLPDEKPRAAHTAAAPAIPVAIVPANAVKNNSVFVVLGGKAVQRPIQAGPALASGVEVRQGLIGGEELILNPAADLKDGDRVQTTRGAK